jgi:hypothetical protein
VFFTDTEPKSFFFVSYIICSPRPKEPKHRGKGSNHRTIKPAAEVTQRSTHVSYTITLLFSSLNFVSVIVASLFTCYKACIFRANGLCCIIPTTEYPHSHSFHVFSPLTQLQVSCSINRCPSCLPALFIS